jgi:HK97 family phage portal protein
MGLLSLRKENRDSLNGATAIHPKDPALADLWSGGTNSASGQHVTSDTAMRVSTVYACVTVLSQTLAMLPKYVKQVRSDGGLDNLQNHRLYKQIHNRPNRWQTSFEFFEMMEGHRLLRGNAYARIVAYPGRGINELVPMHPDRVWPFVVTPSGVTYFMYDNSPSPPPGSKLYYQYGDTEILLSDEVLHVRGFSTNGIVGMNPITRAAREAVGLAMATEETGARLFSNGAQISKIFKHPTKMSDAVYERMKKQMDAFSGSSNAGKTMILEEGMGIESLSMTMDNAQFLETRKFQVEDIARIFNVPLVLIGHGDKAPTYASAEQFFMSFKVHTMHPNCKRWEEAMERDLLYPQEVNQVEIVLTWTP